MRRRHANNRALETLCRFGAGQLGFRPLPRAARLQNRARGHGGRTGLASSGGQLDRQVHHEHATLSLSGFTLKTICRSSYLQGSRALSAWRRQPPPTTARVSKSSNRHDACGQNHPSIHLRADDACGQMALTWMDGSTKQARKLTKSTRLSVPRAIRAAGTHRGCGDRGNVFLLVHGSYWEASTLPFARTMMMTRATAARYGARNQPGTGTWVVLSLWIPQNLSLSFPFGYKCVHIHPGVKLKPRSSAYSRSAARSVPSSL
jgi:hypothetical protein